MRKNLSLYIHIPFCVKKCIYCDFLSFGTDSRQVKHQGSVRRAYIDALCKEIISYHDISRDYMVTTIFIGGGTPSILLPGEIKYIMAAIRSVFMVAKDAEITIEVNPGTLTAEKAEEYIECGINRMSIGLQSAHDDELELLGRIHNYDQFLASYKIAREAGFKNINIDIMSAIPGQTLHTYLDTVEKVLKLQPEHISSYSLIVEEHTPLAANEELLALLPDEDAEREMYDATKRLLEIWGYKRYEISNYAKQGFACRHNKVYWTLGNYIGMGIGASSFFAGRRFTNTDNLERYIYSIQEASQCIKTDYEHAMHCLGSIKKIDEEVNSDRLMEEYMFLGLRMMSGISAAEFYDYFGRSVYDIYGDIIKKYAETGYLVNDGGNIRLTGKGIDVSNVILADFLLE